MTYARLEIQTQQKSGAFPKNAPHEAGLVRPRPKRSSAQAGSASVFLQLTRWNAAVTWRWIDDLLHLTRRQMTRKMASAQRTRHQEAQNRQILDSSHCHGL